MARRELDRALGPQKILRMACLQILQRHLPAMKPEGDP
jgi:hypothetical protein